MSRAIIYARYSTDLQNERSVEDQIVLCQDHARKLGLTVVGREYDRAASGGSTFGRPGLTRIMNLAERGGFDVLITEAPDRVSRDMADLAGIHKSLEFRGIEIQCVNGGQMNTLSIGMHGVMGQMQREEGARKVRRGMAGVVREGRSAGGRAYGYRPVPGKAGELSINDDEAKVVRRIFQSYAAGISPRKIAASLNSEGVAAPRGEKWNASTINGSGKRGHGILRNPVYAGQQIWNRVRMVKDPATGRRVSRTNPKSDWQVSDCPQLRIVDQVTFDFVQERKEAIGGEHQQHAPKSRRLLSGLLRCGACNGGMSIIGHDRLGPRLQCTTFRESKSCKNGARYYVEKIELLVVDSLRSQLANTELVQEYVKAYRAERGRIEAQARKMHSSVQRQLSSVRAEIDRLVRSIAKGLIEDSEAATLLAPLRVQRESLEIEARAAEAEANVVELHPQAVRRFKENVEALAEILAQRSGPPDFELLATFQSLVATVVVIPRVAGGHHQVNIKGYLASLMGLEVSAVPLVAGERFGVYPPTRTLPFTLEKRAKR